MCLAKQRHFRQKQTYMTVVSQTVAAATQANS